MMRIGLGYDLHQLVADRKLILGGVIVPYDKGLLGHSDGDALAHAIIDAILGAAALGDIGQRFPDRDKRYKDADSMKLLRGVVTLIKEKGYRIVNVDANIIAQEPKLAPHISAIRDSLAVALDIDRGYVSVKAKTNESVGPEGRGEAISTQAIVLLETV